MVQHRLAKCRLRLGWISRANDYQQACRTRDRLAYLQSVVLQRRSRRKAWQSANTCVCFTSACEYSRPKTLCGTGQGLGLRVLLLVSLVVFGGSSATRAQEPRWEDLVRPAFGLNQYTRNALCSEEGHKGGAFFNHHLPRSAKL